MKLETTITQPLSVPMALMPQLTLSETPPLLAAPLTLIPALSVTEASQITPLRQAFFTAPVASDFETHTASVSLPQQFELARAHPLLASAATELARLSESAQTVSSFVFAKPAVVSGTELPSPVTVKASVAVENILQVPSLSGVKTPIKNVVRAETMADKTDGGTLIKNVVHTKRVPDKADKTDGGTLIENVARVESSVDKTDGESLIKNAVLAENMAADKTDDRTLIENVARAKNAVDKTGGESFIKNTVRVNGSVEDSANNGTTIENVVVYPDSVPDKTDGESLIESLQTSQPTTRIIQQRIKLMQRETLIGPRGKSLLTKFVSLAPALLDELIKPLVRPVIDLRALFLPLEDRNALMEGSESKNRVAKISQMGADADSEGGQNQDSDTRQ